MFGAIIGDIAGSVYEFANCKRTDVPLFPPGANYTDDTVLTVATCEVLLNDGDYAATYRRLGRKYSSPMGGYGMRFCHWLFDESTAPYGSWGNGSAMRVGPVGFAMDSLDAVLAEAAKSASVTHNHPEGVRGAQATAAAVFLGRTGASKEEIRGYITTQFGYDLTRTVDEIRPSYSFDESCQGTVPEAIIAFLDSTNFESAIRLAISLGGDADTLGCITGGIAEAFYKDIPAEMVAEAKRRLPDDLLRTVEEFTTKHASSAR